MKRVILYVLFVVFAVSVTAKPFNVVDVATFNYTKTDTVTLTHGFNLSYKGSQDTLMLGFEPSVGSAVLNAVYVNYVSKTGHVLTTDTISSITTLGKLTYTTIKIDKRFPMSVNMRIVAKYKHNGKSTGNLYYIIY
jgi:hypothetical protein